LIPSLELQKALVKSLSVSTYKVYEVVPTTAVMPFIKIGEEMLLTDDTKTNDRYTINFFIHSFAKGTSSAQAKTLNDFILNRLLKNPLEINGFFCDYVNLEMFSSQREIEEGTTQTVFHGIFEFSFQLTSKEE
jgi:hypothetical protein